MMGEMRRACTVGWVTGISEVFVTYMEVWGRGGRRRGRRGGQRVSMGDTHPVRTVG